MAQLTIEIPDHLARWLESVAAVQKKSVEQVALERLNALLTGIGSPAAVLRAMKQPPCLNSTAVDDLDAAIANGRLPLREQGRL